MKKPKPKTTKGHKATSTNRGRPRVYETNLPVYDSMEQMNAVTGIPVTAQKYAKKNGCLSIRHGRCHLGEFLRWWFAQDLDTEDGVDWAKRDKRASALIKEVKLEEEQNRVIDFLLVERFIRMIVYNSFFGEIERMQNEFPALLKGKSEIEIKQEVLKQVTKMKKTIEEQVKSWASNKGK